MDAATLNYYAANAKALAERYNAVESTAARYFAMAFLPGGRVLDIGCGSGRDLNALLAAGYDATGVDASPEMLAAAVNRHPALRDRIRQAALPELVGIPDASQDGLLCWAVLMHLSEESLFDVAFNLRRVLRAGGRLLLSTPIEGPEVDAKSHRDSDGRLFSGITPENLHFLLAKVGFRRLNRWDADDSLGRAGRRWATQLFVLEGQGSQSLETIESILNRDRKDATYKPALFRALAELATTSYSAAHWLPDGEVAIPLGLIADKWLEYYWPLFESPVFIPQKRGEKRACLKPVAFRAELENLINYYRGQGGLCRFSVEHRSKALPPDVARTHRRVLARISHAIRVGPVHFAGGGGSGTFRYEHSFVVMQADLWRELSAMGNWIADATVLRWAELTAEISQGEVQVSQVVDRLLTVPIPEREVATARDFYDGMQNKLCVWTERALEDEFDVDHAIPFVLWRNNDLWNLLPAARTVNNEKRDRLPTRSLVLARKPLIIDYWSRMRDAHKSRFDFEIEKLVGTGLKAGGNWENRLFHAVAEAVEFTAIQRGVERWEPGARRARARRSAPRSTSQTPGPKKTSIEASPRILSDPPLDERFIKCVPFFEVQAAAGAFGPEQPAVDRAGHRDWIEVSGRRLTPDMFAIRVIGRSMEPLIQDGSCCLFRGGEALAGSRNSRIVLVSLRDSVDPESSGRLTVKRYSSQKVADADTGFRHLRIELQPLNPDYTAIVIEAADDEAIRVLGEFVAVISLRADTQTGNAPSKSPASDQS